MPRGVHLHRTGLIGPSAAFCKGGAHRTNHCTTPLRGVQLCASQRREVQADDLRAMWFVDPGVGPLLPPMRGDGGCPPEQIAPLRGASRRAGQGARPREHPDASPLRSSPARIQAGSRHRICRHGRLGSVRRARCGAVLRVDRPPGAAPSIYARPRRLAGRTGPIGRARCRNRGRARHRHRAARELVQHGDAQLGTLEDAARAQERSWLRGCSCRSSSSWL